VLTQDLTPFSSAQLPFLKICVKFLSIDAPGYLRLGTLKIAQSGTKICLNFLLSTVSLARNHIFRCRALSSTCRWSVSLAL
jgi:hypothetical protein